MVEKLIRAQAEDLHDLRIEPIDLALGEGDDEVIENLSYSAQRAHEVWPTRFSTVASAEPYAHNPRALGNKVYGEGEIQSFVNVYVDGEDVRTRDGLETPVRDSSTVILLPAMAGGCAR